MFSTTEDGAGSCWTSASPEFERLSGEVVSSLSLEVFKQAMEGLGVVEVASGLQCSV